MQYILHVTNKCNFSCDYCDVPKNDSAMDKSTAFKVVDFALENALKIGHKAVCMSFYGGEPLLCKDLIYNVIDYCKDISKNTNVNFSFKLTTNGWFIDEPFLKYAKTSPIDVALSIDGIEKAHDMHRLTTDNKPTFKRVYEIAKALIAQLPDSSAMLTVNPNSVEFLLESIKFLFDNGFKIIVTTPNFSTDWTEEDLDNLKNQYEGLAAWYGEVLLEGKELHLPIFDNKIINWLTPEIMSDKCIPGKYRVSVDVEGNIYPCIQYVYNKKYEIGNFNRLSQAPIDDTKLKFIVAESEKGMAECDNCALNSRCDNKCGCKNLALTGSLKKVSPLVCAHEQILIPIADALGNRIFIN